MYAYDYEAVVFDGEVYCNECLTGVHADQEEDVQPIFADSTWDTPPVCTVCGTEHDYMNVLSTNEEYLGDPDESWDRSPHYDDDVQFEGKSPQKPEV